MTDVDLIEALRTCSEYPGCEHCPLCGVIECTSVAANSLEAVLAENEKLEKQLILRNAQLLELREENAEQQTFAAGAMAMQEAVLDILDRMSVRNKGTVRSALRDAMAAVNNLEVEHE